MDKKELKKYLKENLTIEIRKYDNCVEVCLKLEDETISLSNSYSAISF